MLLEEAAFRPFINPDEIAVELGGSNAINDLKAARDGVSRTATFIDSGTSFTRESTMSGREILRAMQRASDSGFEVRLVFIGAESVALTMHRVRHRVAKGGHDIPPEVQERRFRKSFENAVLAAEIADRSYFFENGEEGHVLVGECAGGSFRFATDTPPDWLTRVAAGLASP